jgi:TPR repeat protein
MRTFTSLLSLLCFAVLPVSSLAGPLEDGTQAFNKNDYVRALLLLEPLANEGNARAQAMVGEMLLRGCCGAKLDPQAGLDWLRKAAAQDDTEAQSLLGKAYLDGDGTKANFAEALKWLLKAAEKGDASAQEALGDMYQKGLGVKKNIDEAKKWYAKARRPAVLPKDAADALTATNQITLYSLEPWGGPDIPQWSFQGYHLLGHTDLSGEAAKKAVAVLTTALAEGQANMMSMCAFEPRHAFAFRNGNDAYDILICYACSQLEIYKNNQRLPFEGMISGTADGLNSFLTAAKIPLAGDKQALERSYAEEAKAALKLAEAGDATAQEVIAKMFLIGRGVTKDEAKGIEWLAKSLGTSPDQPEFQVTIGKLYAADTDQFVKHDYAKAMKLFQQASARGNAEAQYRIGFLYEFGQGVPRNQAEAMKWYLQSAENGYPQAQFSVGVCYAQGRDVPQDYAKALSWLQKAADHAHSEALAWLGTMYQEGRGVPKDQMEAYFWDQLAVKCHTMYGNRVPFHPTPEQYTTLQKRIDDWVAAHPNPWHESF